MIHFIREHWEHGTTSIFGFGLAATSLSNLVTILGVVIGIGGLACSVSRELRGWRDRKGSRP